MTLIVSDNSPLNLLIRLGLAEIPHRFFTEVVIPPEVAEEMRHPKAPQLVRDFIASPPPWLRIQTAKSAIPLPHLDPGEAAAISLAVELQATLTVDERDGREAAVAQGLKIIGAIGILERAADKGLIADLAKVHARIRLLRFHAGEAVLRDSLARHLTSKQK